MAVNTDTMSPQLKVLKATDMSPLVRMGNLLVPRLLGAFLPTLDERQRKAFDRIMPVGGQNKFYIQLVGTPTPPIVIAMAQPPKLAVVLESEVREQKIRGIRLTVEDLQALYERRWVKLVWRLRSQVGSLLYLFWMFAPLLRLGPAELKDLRTRATAHFKPLLGLLPRQSR